MLSANVELTERFLAMRDQMHWSEHVWKLVGIVAHRRALAVAAKLSTRQARIGVELLVIDTLDGQEAARVVVVGVGNRLDEVVDGSTMRATDRVYISHNISFATS